MAQPALTPALRAPRGVRGLVGRVVVLKIGGAVVADRGALEAIAEDVALLSSIGARPVVVHGGGPQIDETLRALGRAPQRVEGLRVTDEATLEVVEMVLGGRVNPRVVAALSSREIMAVGLTGREAGWLRAERVEALEGPSGTRYDPGRVGRPTELRDEIPRRLLDAGLVPVVAPIGVDARGEALNVNADAGAGAIAAALGAHALVLYTDAGSVRDARGEALPSLELRRLGGLRRRGVVSGGMIPKLEAARAALRGGVGEAYVLPARRLAASLRLLGESRLGTALAL